MTEVGWAVLMWMIGIAGYVCIYFHIKKMTFFSITTNSVYIRYTQLPLISNSYNPCSLPARGGGFSKLRRSVSV